MTIEKVVFPSFRDDSFGSFDMRQLVSALEHRFNAIENELETEDTASGDYAPLDHSHEVADITDLDLSSYLTDLSGQSIFDLSDVSGSGSNRKTLVWEGGASGGFTTRNFYLSQLDDVDVSGIGDGDRIAWDETSAQFVPVAAGDELTVDLTDLEDHDLLYNDNGTWRPTEAELQWNPDSNYLLLGNDVPVLWRNAAYTGVELLIFDSADEFTIGDPSYAMNLDASEVRIRNSSGSDYAELSHDGTDFLIEFTNTTDWDVTGITAMNVQANLHVESPITGTPGFDNNSLELYAPGAVSGDIVALSFHLGGVNAAQLYYEVDDPTELVSDKTLHTLNKVIADNDLVGGNNLDLAGNALVSGNVEIDGSGWGIFPNRIGAGTVPNLTGAVIQADGDIHLTGGVGLLNSSNVSENVFYASGTTAEYANIRNFVDDATLLHILPKTGDPTADDRESTLVLMRQNDSTGDAEFLDLYNNGYHAGVEDWAVAYGLRIQKRGTGEYRKFLFDWYDGTTQTEGMEALSPDDAGGPEFIFYQDVDIQAALTATSYGGITEANLLDKTADELITGEYTFEHSGDNVVFNKTASTSGNYLRFNNEAGTPRWRIGEGSDTDDNLDFYAYDDSGVFRATVMRFDGLTDNISITWNTDITGALTATSYGGILEANLLDKTADESVTGAWDFDGFTQFDGNTQFNGAVLGTHITDLNGVAPNTSGYNKFWRSSFSPANAPTGANYWTGWEYRHPLTSDYTTQVAYGSSSGAPILAVRQKVAGTYEPWSYAVFNNIDETITGSWDFDANVELRNGANLYIYDAAETANGRLYHTGTNLQLVTNTGNVQVATEDFDLISGSDLRIRDATNSDYAVFRHDGTDFNTDFTGTTDWNVTNASKFKLFDGAALVFYDSTDADASQFYHDGDDLVLADVASTTRGYRLEGLNFYIQEQAAAASDSAGFGQLWVKNDTPNVLYFTDDAGTDHNLLATSGVSASDAATYNSAGVWWFEHESASVTAGNWYTIATNPSSLDITVAPTGSGGTRAEGHFIVNDAISGGHSFVEFTVAHHYGNDPVVHILKASSFGGTPMADRIRVVELGTYDGVAIQVYAGKTGTMNVLMRSTLQTAGFTLKTPTTETPEGTWNIVTFDLNSSSADDVAWGLLTGSGAFVDYDQAGNMTMSGSELRVFHGDGHANRAALFGRSEGQHVEFEVGDNAGYIRYVQDETDATSHFLAFDIETSNTGSRYMDFTENGTAKFRINHGADLVQIYAGYGLRIYDSTNSDWIEMGHDGVDFNMTGVNSTDLDIDGFSAVRVAGNVYADELATNNTSSTSRDGIGLYGSNGNDPVYGLLFTGTTGYGTHGGVTGGWATYFNMNNDVTRGWVFRNVTTGPVASIDAGGDMYIDGEFYVGGDTIGHFESVTGNYGSVQVSGGEGSSGTYAGYSIDGNWVFMSNGASIAGIYNDTDDEWHLIFDRNSSTRVYHNGAETVRTQAYNATGSTSGLQIRDHINSYRDVGFNVLPIQTEDASDTLEAKHCGGVFFKDGTTGVTLTLEASTGTDFPVSGVCTIINAGSSGNITVSEGSGTTLYVLTGSGRTDAAGSATVAAGSVATLWREATTIYYLFGNGVTP